jgi:transposase InsO family protein
LAPHEHWHIDVTYINIHGTFYYLCAVLDRASRYIVDWALRETMTEPEVEILLQRVRERFPGAGPRIISDKGPQFIAKDFKEFIRISGMTHVRTSAECIRPGVPLSFEDGRRLVEQYIRGYSEERLHSGIGYVTPPAVIEGRREAIQAERDQKLEQARLKRGQQTAGTELPERSKSESLSQNEAA